MSKQTSIRNREILQGDVLQRLKDIPDNSIDCIITSPPYWGLRNYKMKGQMGSEPTFHGYLAKLWLIMDECKRILKSSGTAWINLGDVYGSHSSGEDKKYSEKIKGQKPGHEIIKGYEKSLLFLPHRFAIRCVDDGWICRNDCKWLKPNGMPDSAQDRFTIKTEYVFFMAINKRYFFNLEAVKEPLICEYKPGKMRKKDPGYTQSTLADGGVDNDKDYLNGQNSKHANQKTNSNSLVKFIHKKRYEARKDKVYLDNSNTKHSGDKSDVVPGSNVSRLHRDRKGSVHKRDDDVLENEGRDHDNPFSDTGGKNPGDVFVINTQPFSGAHFATFPLDLPIKIIKCAVPEKVCVKCGVPQTKIKVKSEPDQYTDCGCGAGYKPGIVLDPFFGAGTTAVAAEMLDRNWCGIELNTEYIDIARRRLYKYQNDRLQDMNK